MSDVKSIFIERLEADIESLKKDAAGKVEELGKAIEILNGLSEEEVVAEFMTQEDNIRFLAQFTAQKPNRDAAYAEINKKDGEIEPMDEDKK